MLNILVKNFGFDDRGLRSNMKLFQEVKDAGHDIEAFLLSIEDKAKQANSPQAYAVKSLQNLLRGVKPPYRRVVIDPAITSAATLPTSLGKKQTASKPIETKKKNSRLAVKDADAFDDSGLEEL